MDIITKNAVYIPSLDGKDIYMANHHRHGVGDGYRLKRQNGQFNYARFVNTLDYSLDLIKLRDIFSSICPHEEFSVWEKKKEYSCQVINVTFKYSDKEFNRARGSYYIRNGYSFEELDFSEENCDGLVFDGDMLVGVHVNNSVRSPLSEQALYDICPYFRYDKETNTYQARKNIPTVHSVSDIRTDLYENGFICDGTRYVRFKRSSGSSRVGKCLFINEKLYDKMHQWEMCGVKVSDGDAVDLAALEPYIALTLSSIIDTIQIKPENILVIPDYESRFYEKTIATRLEEGRLVSKSEYVEICNKIWDGQSLMDKSLFGDYADKGMLLLRARFFKSCCFNANIQQWFEDNGITSVKALIQAGGRTVATDIRDIKLITTPSSIKYLKFGSLDTWLEKLEPTCGVVKYEKPTPFFDGRMVQTHYQLINTLQMTQEEVNTLVQPSLDYMRMIKTDPAIMRHKISYQYQMPDELFYTKAVTCRNDVIYKLLGINDKFSQTKLYRQFCNDLIKSFVKNLRCGHILVHGNYSTLCGNPIEMLKAAIGTFQGQSVIEKGTVHSEMFADGKALLGSRSPHVTIGNVLLARNMYRQEIQTYMNPTKEIVYVNSINENLLERLSGADFDSDTMLLTDNEILVTAAKRNYENFPVPTKLVESTKRNRRYTDAEKADLDIKTSVNKIGEIINLSQELNSILWDRVNHGASVDDVMELYCDIAQLDVMSNLEIDSAKRENPANNAYELKCLKRKYDVRDKKGRHIRPMFFKYIDGYKGYRSDYYVYQDGADEEPVEKIGGMLAYKDAIECKSAAEQNGSGRKVYVERGRMSYRNYETAMDYLQRVINKFRAPYQSEVFPLSEVLTNENVDGEYQENVEQQIIELIQIAREKVNQVWNGHENSSRIKREKTEKVRQECIAALQTVPVTQTTIRSILRNLEMNYSELSRFAFFILLDRVNYHMKTMIEKLLRNSRTSIEKLVEDENGDIRIYDFYYKKEVLELPYENQEEFRKMVNQFLERYNLPVSWLAQKFNIMSNNFSAYLKGNRNMSQSKRMEIYWFMVDFKERNQGLL